MEAPPSPLSSRPEKLRAFGPPKVMKNGFCSATTLNGSAALPFVISTGEVMCLRPTRGDEKWVLFSNHTQWKRRPPLCHLDRSEAQWRDLRYFLGNVFLAERTPVASICPKKDHRIWVEVPPKYGTDTDSNG
jgi:hypothetical protein